MQFFTKNLFKKIAVVLLLALSLHQTASALTSAEADAIISALRSIQQISDTQVSAIRGLVNEGLPPTASIGINGQQEYTVRIGETIPAITWAGTPSTTASPMTYVTKYTVASNKEAVCGFKSGTWTYGKTASGSSPVTAMQGATRRGCEVTYTYTVTNTKTNQTTNSLPFKLIYSDQLTTPDGQIGFNSTFTGDTTKTVKTGETVPTIYWAANANSNKAVTNLEVTKSTGAPSSTTCSGLKTGVWTQGNTTAARNSPVTAAVKAMEGCTLKFTYVASNTVSGSTDTTPPSVTVVYEANTSAITSSITSSATIARIGETAPTITWSSSDNTNSWNTIVEVSKDPSVNTPATCGAVTWVNGKTKNGSALAPAPTQNLNGCIIKFKYTASHTMTGVAPTTSEVSVTYSSAAPTARILIGGQQNHTVNIGEAVPVITWEGTPSGTGMTYVTTRTVPADKVLSCGFSSGTWTYGKTASGATPVNTPETGSRRGCIVTYTYTVTNTRTDQPVSATATLNYSNDLVLPTATLKANGSDVASFTIPTGGTAPTISWESTNGNNYSTTVANNGKCAGVSNGAWSQGRTASGSAPAPAVAANMNDCEITYTYSVRNTIANSGPVSDTLIVKYPSASTTPVTTIITPTIAKGATGEKVTLVQQALKQAGYFKDEVTGYFGDVTKNAVAAFQKANALDNVGAVGAVGPKTAELLNKLLGF